MNKDAALTIANTIWGQIEFGVKMSLGASDPSWVLSPQPGLTFLARIIPFTKTGKRGSGARIMRVTITLNGLDYYDIDVHHELGGVIHYRTENIDVSTLNRLLLALDYDGPTVLNPRYL